MKIEFYKPIAFFLVFFSSLYPIFGQYQWPFAAPNVQATVQGSVGEYRYTEPKDPTPQNPAGVPEQHRFHKGVDLANGTDYRVYAINSGTVYWNRLTNASGSFVSVTSASNQAFFYFHILPKDEIQENTITTVSVGDYLGDMILEPRWGEHLHLEQSTTNFLRHNLYPYIDNSPPFFATTVLPNSVAFYQNGLLKTSSNYQNLELDEITRINNRDHVKIYNKVDIVAHVIDYRVGPNNGNAAGGQMVPSITSWRVRNTLAQTISQDELRFDGIPNNEGAKSAFHPLSTHAGNPSVHIITSHPRNWPFDRFWNTRLRTGQIENYILDDATHTRNSNLDARINSEAAYPDGIYLVDINASDVDYDNDPNLSANQLTVNTVIDNFKPFINSIEVRENGPNGNISYTSNWEWNATNGTLRQVYQHFSDIKPLASVWIKITASEPVVNVKFNITEIDGSAYTDINNSTDNSKSVFVISKSMSASGEMHINIQANDLAGNSLHSTPSELPVHQQDGTWSGSAGTGTDANHFFNVGNFVCTTTPNGGGRKKTSSNNGRTENSICLYNDFYSNQSIGELNESITFTPVVSGNGLISYSWNFGDGAIPATSSTGGVQSVVYTTPGVKNATLQICDGSGNCEVTTKTGIVSIAGQNSDPMIIDFSANKVSAQINDAIQLTSNITNSIGELFYSWDFGDGLATGSFSAPNPTISYSTPGNKTISLTVTDINGRETKVRTSYIYIYSTLWNVQSTIFGCITTGADGIASFSASVSGGNGPPYDSYKWDFGDGETSPQSGIISHTYKKSGKYTVRLTVCDETGCGTTESTNCVTVPSIVDNRTINTDFLIDNIALGPVYSSIQVGLNTPVHFTDATTGGGNPARFDYYWQFDSSIPGVPGSDGSNSAVPIDINTKGPHEVYYTSSGLKNISLTVGLAGIGSYIDDETKQNAIRVINGLGSGRCFATLGEASISNACWTPQTPPKFNISVAKTNCPVAKIEVEWNGYILPDGKFDFVALSQKYERTIAPPQFPYTGDFNFSVYQFDGISYNRIGYKKQRFTIYGPVSAMAGDDQQVCIGNSISLGNETKPNMLYLWSSTGLNLSYLSNTNAANPVFSGVQKGTYTYTVKVTDLVSGCSNSDQVVVNVDRPIITPASISVPLSTPVQISPQTIAGFGGNQYQWNPTTNLSNPNILNPSIYSVTEGNFSYSLTVTDQIGCTSSSQIFVNISNYPADLVATAKAYEQVSLSWLDRSGNETNFILEKSIGSNNAFAPYATVNANITKFIDLNVQKGIVYYYRVYATLPNAVTQTSNETSVNTDILPLFTEITVPFKGATPFGDIDNDGDLDFTNDTNIITNVNGTFVSGQSISFTFKSELADLDNDNDLDIFSESQIHSNSNGLYSTKSNGITSYYYNIEPFDFDNDNDIDFTTLGYSNSLRSLHIISNNQNTYTDRDLNIPFDIYTQAGDLPYKSDFIVAQDLDNDGDQDIIHPGDWIGDTRLMLTINNNQNFSPIQVHQGCCYEGAIDIIDFNSDNRKDAAIAGGKSNNNSKSSFIANGIENSPYLQYVNQNFAVIWRDVTIKWGDSDNDGLVDILLSADNQNNSKVYRNTGDGFIPVFSINTANWFSDFVDFDNDGDLDIATKGNKLYINNLGKNLYKQNTTPTSPNSPCSYFVNDGIMLTWEPGHDNETPEKLLSYNVYLKQNGLTVLSPMSDLATGYRKIPFRGNADSNNGWFLKLPNTSGTIDWGVQSIDLQYKGSPFTSSSINQITKVCGQLTSNTHYGREIYVSDINGGGCTPSTSVLPGNTTTLIASNNIFLKPGLTVSAGSFLKAQISSFSTTNNPCKASSGGRIKTNPQVSEETETEKEYSPKIIAYPNPSNGIFNIEAEFEFPISIEYSLIDATGINLINKKT